MLNKIAIVLIFLITAIMIVWIIQFLSGLAAEQYCTHTQLQELQKSGDYYSCLQGAGK